MTNTYHIATPLQESDIEQLRMGDRVLISGVIYTARDAAHKRIVQAIKNGEEPPFAIEGQVIYYVGPSPAPPGRVIGAAGPTTSYRMDPYTPFLVERGLKAMIGKGSRSKDVKEALKTYKAVYLAAIGGAGALAAKSIKEVEVIAYPELGPEAVRRMVVEEFPAIVVNDIYGGDLYEKGKKMYAVK